MDKKGETIEVSDLYKKIKIIENEISTKKEILDGLNEITTNYDSCKPQEFTVTLSYRVREMVK